MSEVEQAPPAGAEGVPSRPPSPPSRAPLWIWVGVAVFCLVMFGAALGLYLWSREAFSSKDLKQAKSVKINYLLKGNRTKTVVVDAPPDLPALLDSLKITDTRPGDRYYGITTSGSVDFTLPDGKVAQVK
ncbi:MAG TPA: hypothetical protein VFW33_00040, partial [Gemmataceae bacterium]|nr:hypothetical protein [Gemmataceae bacterium]